MTLQDQAKEIKEQHDLRYIIPKTPKRTINGNLVMDCCPFHDDTRPSFAIYPSYYRCFSCRSQGDLFDYLKAKRNWNFLTVVQRHKELPLHLFTPEPIVTEEKPAKIFPSEMALSYHFKCDQKVTNFYARKGITKATVLRFKLGFGVHPDDDRFNADDVPDSKKLFTIPLFDDGKLVGIKFRRNDCCPLCWNTNVSIVKTFAVENEAQEKENKSTTQNKPNKIETATCLKCKHSWGVVSPKYRSLKGQKVFLWGLDDIPSDYNETVFIVEGEFDRMVMWQHGLYCVTPTGGAMSWNKRLATKLERFRRKILLRDQDDAGLESAKLMQKFIPDLKVFTDWKEGKDVSDVSLVVGDLQKWIRQQDRMAA